MGHRFPCWYMVGPGGQVAEKKWEEPGELNIICKEPPSRVHRIVLRRSLHLSGACDTKLDEKHPFKKYFEELEIGDSVHTPTRLINDEDINQFADISGDYFYAHDGTWFFEDTMFEKRVAHGYFILSAAAGLFVDEMPKACSSELWN